jgi:hypothetical protein
MMSACGHAYCGSSTGIDGSLTFGRGHLYENGYWQYPCSVCARAFEKVHPEFGSCWPFERGKPTIAAKDSQQMTVAELTQALSKIPPHYRVKVFVEGHAHRIATDLRSIGFSEVLIVTSDE